MNVKGLLGKAAKFALNKLTKLIVRKVSGK